MKTLDALFIVLSLTLAACGDDGNSSPRDSGPADAGPDDAPVDAACFAGSPTTNDEIINACTPDSVTKIFKDSHPPLLNNDGTLPPLPP